MTSEPVVDVQQRDRQCWLFLDRPARRNAIDDALVAELGGAVARAAVDPQIDVIVIAGRGPSFCAGADLRHLLEIGERDGEPLGFLRSVSALVTDVERCPKPVVAALHGHVVAGGLEIALACDVVVAAEHTLIGDGHLRNRLMPAAGSSVRLPRKVGAGLARRLMLTGELLPAEAFLASGWVSAVVPDEELHAEAALVADALSRVASPAQHNLKRLLIELEELTPPAGLAAELRAFGANWTEADVPAALRAFLTDRRPTGSR